MQAQTVAEINLGALRANYRTAVRLAAPAGVIPAVKTDAYGLGAVPVARCLAAEGARLFAVVTLTEGVALRRSGLAQDILVMGVVDPARVREALESRLIVALHGDEQAAACAAAARAAGGQLRCHLKVDTGMNRWGVPASQAVDLLAKLKCSPEIKVEGLMTHFAQADEADLGPAEEQLARFQALLAELERRGLRPPIVHAANSPAMLRLPQARFDFVRPGLALYGLSPCPELTPDVQLRPVMAVYSVVALVKEVAAGEGASYNHTWRARRPSRVAIVPIGYADGYCRAFSNRAVVRVEGQLAPVAGNVCMDATLIDVTEIPAACVGSRVALLEADAGSPLSAWALAKLARTIPHEILTGIGSRVRRVYVEGD